MHLPSPPQPGQICRVRQRRYLVDETVPPPDPSDATLVRLSCVDDDAQGQALEVLWEKEVDPEILSGGNWHELASRGFDPPRLFGAYYHTLRWNCVTATDPKLFQAPFRAGIKIDAYQLEPLRKGPGPRPPRVFYDPRALDPDATKRASLHAKCIVVHRERAFVSSANFTEAAQARNIEVGVLVRSKDLAGKVAEHFEKLAKSGVLMRVPGLGEG